MIALLSAAVGSAHAAVLNPAPSQTNIFDLVRDGSTSLDGGDMTVTRQDPLVTAVSALEATTVSWRQVSFTGPVDSSAAVGSVFPRVPLGAAPGTRPDDDFATPLTGAWHWNAWQKSLAVGLDRIAPLIGTIGNGPSPSDKPGSTVFVAEGPPASFNDGGAPGVRSSSVTAFAPSSTSTATITVAGAGNFRQRAGSGFSVAAANSLQAMPKVSEPAAGTVVLADAGQPTLGYHYAPAPAGPAPAAASFSGAVTAVGRFARIDTPLLPAKAQASDVAATYARLIDLTQPIEGKTTGTHVDGTRTFLSASVSANPATTAALYVANVVNSAPASRVGQTVEAFQIGPTPGPRTPSSTGTSVSDPLHGKIMASAGALNNSLALP